MLYKLYTMLHQHTYGTPAMPLLMGFTPQTPIQTCDVNEKFIYDEFMQITEYDMVTVGTKSLKIRQTGQKIDRKNEIDDSKTK